jgi:hypothetical protein
VTENARTGAWPQPVGYADALAFVAGFGAVIGLGNRGNQLLWGWDCPGGPPGPV